MRPCQSLYHHMSAFGAPHRILGTVSPSEAVSEGIRFFGEGKYVKVLLCSELVRYRQFLGIQNEAKNIAQSRGSSNPADKCASALKPSVFFRDSPDAALT